MKDHHFIGEIWPPRRWTNLFLGLVLVFCGCQAKEPPLSQAAASFKKEVKECIERLSSPLIEPMSKRDVGAINETLKKTEPEAIKLCRMCPFRIGILDKNGDTITVYPLKEDAKGDFSSYKVVVQTLKSRRTTQQQFFMQDGSQVYIICVPLIHKEELLGVMALVVGAEEAKKRWGLTEKEFMSIDFN